VKIAMSIDKEPLIGIEIIQPATSIHAMGIVITKYRANVPITNPHLSLSDSRAWVIKILFSVVDKVSIGFS
jgi:hypothetical protein